MDCSKTINFLHELQRLCDSSGSCSGVLYNREDCPMFTICRQIKKYGKVFDENKNAKKAIKIVQKWSDEHSRKTYAQDFFEKFPGAQRALDGTPFACKKRIYDGTLQRGEELDCTEIWSCKECWNEPMEE